MVFRSRPLIVVDKLGTGEDLVVMELDTDISLSVVELGTGKGFGVVVGMGTNRNWDTLVSKMEAATMGFIWYTDSAIT